jgi:hypothetical protein
VRSQSIIQVDLFRLILKSESGEKGTGGSEKASGMQHFDCSIN